MAISTNSPEKTPTHHQQPVSDNPNPSKPDPPDASAAPPPTIPTTIANATATVASPNPNPNPSLNNLQLTGVTPPPQAQSFVPPSQVTAVHPSFRPATLPVPVPSAPQFSPIPNPSFQTHGIQGQVPVQVQPPGVMVQPPSQASGAMPSVPPMMPPQYGQQPVRMYAPMPNGYQMAVPQGTMNPPVCFRSMSW